MSELKLRISGDLKKQWTQEEWNILDDAINSLIDKRILKPEEIQIDGFYIKSTSKTETDTWKRNK